MDDINQKIEELTQQIAELPVGYISKKTIHGKVRCYLQWSENGQKKSKYVDDATAEELMVKIDQRRVLQQQLKELRSTQNSKAKISKAEISSDSMSDTSSMKNYENTAASESDMNEALEQPAVVPVPQKIQSETVQPSSLKTEIIENTDSKPPVSEKRHESRVVTPSLNELQLPVLFGKTLQDFVSIATGLKNRPCIAQIQEYLVSPVQEKICVIYGLLHSGKTTLIRQIIHKMNASGFERSALIIIHKGDTLSQVFHDIRFLQSNGFKYLFLDNVTLLSDFAEGSAMFADTFAASGLKIVMTGDESLSFIVSAEEPLYQKCEWIHTSPASFVESTALFSKESGDSAHDSYKMDLDEYLVNGGILTTEKAGEYLDAAVVRNLSVTLECMEKDHFTSLQNLRTLNNLKGAVYAALDDLNDRFLMDAFKRSLAYQSRGVMVGSNYFGRGDLALENGSKSAMSHLNLPLITERMKDRLVSLVRGRRSESRMTEEILNDVFDFMNLIDLTCEVPVQFLPVRSSTYSQILITIPSIRYEMISNRVKGLLADLQFRNFNSAERQYIYGRIMGAVKDQILRDHVIIETVRKEKNKDILRLQFSNCEIDMILCDPEKHSCEMYLISNSCFKIPEFSRLFTNKQRCKAVEQRYGKVTKKVILYRGATQYSEIEDILYQNAEEYLSELSKGPK